MALEACRQLREMPDLAETHIIFLTARSEEYSEIAAFEVGADDFINKPIKPRALSSRIAALFRKETKKVVENVAKVTIGDLVIDRVSYIVFKKGVSIILPKKEFELLYFLGHEPKPCI